MISKAVGLTLACITLKRKCTVRFSLQYLHPFPAKTFRALLGIALPSGTEALIRVMVEAKTTEVARKVAEDLADLIKILSEKIQF